MTAHTPGPWFAEDRRIWHFNGMACIAQVFDGVSADSTTDDHEANARLISAAPDLLVALEALLECWAYAVPRHAEDHNIADQARAAIAKARNQGS